MSKNDHQIRSDLGLDLKAHVEQLLPRNTCSLIKSSFGFKLGKVSCRTLG